MFLEPMQNRTSHSLFSKKPAPGKRDFQDHNPPRTPEELYQRHDPSLGLSTVVILGLMLGLIIVRTSSRYLGRTLKRRLRKTKTFGKYFPQNETKWPPLHVAERMAREEGIQLPKSLIIKLTEQEGHLEKIINQSKSHAWVTAAVISPLALEHKTHLSIDKEFAGDKATDKKFNLDPTFDNCVALPNVDMDVSSLDLGGLYSNNKESQADLGRKEYSSANLLLKIYDANSIPYLDVDGNWLPSSSLGNRSSSLDEGLLSRCDL